MSRMRLLRMGFPSASTLIVTPLPSPKQLEHTAQFDGRGLQVSRQAFIEIETHLAKETKGQYVGPHQ